MRFIIVLFSLLLSKVIYAQKIKGIVTDENEYPLEGVYIYNVNSTEHAHTLENGMFTIEGSKIGDSIEVGMLGFHKKVILLTQVHVDNGIAIQLKSKIFCNAFNSLVITNSSN